MSPLFSAIYVLILLILAGNEDMHKSLNEFEFWPDLTIGYEVTGFEKPGY